MDLDGVSILVLDEVDCVLQKGFREQVMQIYRALSQPQALMYSATVSKEVEKMASILTNDLTVVTVGNPGNQNSFVKQVAIWVESKQKKKKLFDILTSQQHFLPPAVVFVAIVIHHTPKAACSIYLIVFFNFHEHIDIPVGIRSFRSSADGVDEPLSSFQFFDGVSEEQMEDTGYNSEDSDIYGSNDSDSHCGSSGYEEEDDDDDNGSDSEIDWIEDKEETDHDLENKAEAFISKVIRGWKEEQMNDKTTLTM
ncbi:hypothetical protein AgCh_019905 [Apium graveolens]